MKVYLETSVILRKLLGEPDSLREWGHWEEVYTSELTRVESLRTLDRLRLQGDIADDEISERRRQLGEILAGCDHIAMTRAVLDAAARSYPTVVGTLDALHLSSAMLYAERRKSELVFLTHDVRLGIAARAVGMRTLGVNLDA